MTTTTYKNWNIGDKVNICASVTSFCGSTTEFVYAYDINTIKLPNTCSLEYGSSGCGIHINNIELTFSLVKGHPSSGCIVAQTYKTIGSTRTNSNGVATIEYTITEQDQLDYISAKSEGYFYYVMSCITNGDGQQVSGQGKTTDAITIFEPEITHNLDITLIPWSWYSPGGAVDEITTKISDINGSIMNLFEYYDIIDYQYIGTDVFTENNNVIIRVKLKSTNLESVGVPFLVYVAVFIAAIFFIVASIGRISGYIFGLNKVALTNEDLTTAGNTFGEDNIDGIITLGCADPSLTQDQKSICIKDNTINFLNNWKTYQETIYPDADHSSLENAITEVQTCYNIYNSSSKTISDYQTYIKCIKEKSKQDLDKDKTATLDVYKPDASAGEKEPQPNDIITTIAYVAGGLAFGYIGYKILKKK